MREAQEKLHQQLIIQGNLLNNQANALLLAATLVQEYRALVHQWQEYGVELENEIQRNQTINQTYRTVPPAPP